MDRLRSSSSRMNRARKREKKRPLREQRQGKDQCVGRPLLKAYTSPVNAPILANAVKGMHAKSRAVEGELSTLLRTNQERGEGGGGDRSICTVDEKHSALQLRGISCSPRKKRRGQRGRREPEKKRKEKRKPRRRQDRKRESLYLTT